MRKRFLVLDGFSQAGNSETIESVVNMGTIGFSGIFHVRLLDAETKKEKAHWSFPNVITDAGMDGFGYKTIYNQTQYLAVGTDSTPPSVSDTTLGNEIARTNANLTIPPYSGSVPVPGGVLRDSGRYKDDFRTVITGSGGITDKPYYRLYLSRTFSESEANGNLTELGFFDLSSGGRMWNRALFVDNAGSPITVTKTSSNWLHVTYELRWYVPTEYVTGILTLGTGSYSPQQIPYTSSLTSINVAQLFNHHPWDSWWDSSGTSGFFVDFPFEGSGGGELFFAYETAVLVSPTGSITGWSNSVLASTRSQQTYVDGNRYIEWEVGWTPSEANFASGINGIRIMMSYLFGQGEHFQIVFDDPIYKTNQRLKLRLRVSWDRTIEP